MSSSSVANPVALTLMAVVSTSMAIATILGEWLSTSVQIPIAALLLLMILILVPTGDMIRLVSEHIDNQRPKNRKGGK